MGAALVEGGGEPVVGPGGEGAEAVLAEVVGEGAEIFEGFEGVAVLALLVRRCDGLVVRLQAGRHAVGGLRAGVVVAEVAVDGEGGAVVVLCGFEGAAFGGRDDPVGLLEPLEQHLLDGVVARAVVRDDTARRHGKQHEAEPDGDRGAQRPGGPGAQGAACPSAATRTRKAT